MFVHPTAAVSYVGETVGRVVRVFLFGHCASEGWVMGEESSKIGSERYLKESSVSSRGSAEVRQGGSYERL